MPAEVYFGLANLSDVGEQINGAIVTAMEPLRDIIRVKITTGLERDPDWRTKVKQHVSGEGITIRGAYEATISRPGSTTGCCSDRGRRCCSTTP